jgi:hypothetical protein
MTLATKIKKLSSPHVPKTTPDKTSEPTISAILPTATKNPKSSSSTASSNSQASKSNISNKPALCIQANPLELQLFGDNSAVEYMIEENISAPAYTPTMKEEIGLQGMTQSQKQRVYLNVGGTKFETSVPTLQSDPSSILARTRLVISSLISFCYAL